MQVARNVITITEDERYYLRGALLTAAVDAEYELMAITSKQPLDYHWSDVSKAEIAAKRLVKYLKAIEMLSWDGSNWPVFTTEEMEYEGSNIYFDQCPNCGNAHYDFCKELYIEMASDTNHDINSDVM